MISRIFVSTQRRILLVLLCVAIIAGCAGFESERKPVAVAEIVQCWQGDYPVAQLHVLPEGQREQRVGFISDAKTFEQVWKAFKQGEAVPDIDFKINLVLFARNTQFYNRVSIGKVKVTSGVAEVLAMETMSAMPIQDKVAMSMVVVPREGITAIRRGDKNIPTHKSN